MRKEKCVVLICKKIQKNIIDYYNSFANQKYDIIVVAPSINQELNKNYTKIHFYRDDFFLEPNNYIKNTHRPNWNYQQFLKYSIVLKLNFDIVHIIDGDSVLSSNCFFTKNFYFSEFKLNPKYQNFTDLFTKNLFSSNNYIVNHMVFEKKLLLKMFKFFGINELNYVKIFCSKLNSGNYLFSEYQNYAMFVLHIDKNRKSLKTKVFRRFDLIKKESLFEGLQKYSLLAFENSHKSGILRTLRARIFYYFGINLG